MEDVEMVNLSFLTISDMNKLRRKSASQFSEMAKDEIDHYHKLNEIAQSMLEDNESRIIFDYLHSRNNKRVAECEMLLSM